MRSLITKDEIDSIINQPNLLVRNLQITQGYYEVSKGLRKFASRKHVNWFSFGTYASKSAGHAIRHEILPGRLKSALIRSAGYDDTYMYLHEVLEQPDPADNQHAGNLLARVLTQVSLLLSQGNLLIFQELAWPFTNMIETFYQDWQPDESKWQAFLDLHLRPGPIESGGQEWLRESLTCFYLARFETDAKRKAELILMGNLMVGLHEQTHLQPIIEKAVAVPFDVFTEGLIPDKDEDVNKPGNKFRIQSIGFSRQLVLQTVTRMWMTYSLPTREMRLGSNVVAPTGMVNFPKELLRIQDPRCRQIIGRFDRGLDTLSGSAALNWAELDDRMCFIVDFFRAYQNYKPLLKPPFHPSQAKAIKAGGFPAGQL